MKRLLLTVFAFLTLLIALPVAHAESCLDQVQGVTDISQLKPCKPPSKIGNWQQGDTPLASLTRVFADYNGNTGITDGSVIPADNREQNVSAIGDTQKGPFLMRPEAVNALAEAGKIAKQVGYSLRVNSAYRTTKHQISLSNGSKGVASAGKSAHQSGLAVDIVLMKGGKAVTQCCSFKKVVVSDTEADQQLQRIMTAAGWVRFCWETWHFEYGVGNNNGTRSQECKQNGQGATGKKFEMGGPIAGSSGGGSAATTSGPGGTTPGTGGPASTGGTATGGGTAGGAGGATGTGAGGAGGTGGSSPNGTGATSAELGNTNPTGNGSGSGSNGGLINANLGGKGFAVALQTNFKEAPKSVQAACLAAVKSGITEGPHIGKTVGRGEGRIAFTEFSVDPASGEAKNADQAGNGGWRCSGIQYSYDPEKGESVETPVLHQVIRGNNGLDLLTQYSNKVYIFLASTIGIFAVLMVVLGGVQMIVSGNSDGITKGKERITAALAGMALLFMSSVILYTINPNFFTWEGNAMYTSAGQAGGQKTGSNVQSGILTNKPATTTAAPTSSSVPLSPVTVTGSCADEMKVGASLQNLQYAYAAKWEGYAKTPHKDEIKGAAGYGDMLVGFGYNITKNGNPPGYSGGEMSPDVAVAALRSQMSVASGRVPSAMRTGDTVRDFVLNDMVYNGNNLNNWPGLKGAIDAARKSSKAEDWQKAGNAILDSAYAKQIGPRAQTNARLMVMGDTAEARQLIASTSQNSTYGQGATTWPMICK